VDADDRGWNEAADPPQFCCTAREWVDIKMVWGIAWDEEDSRKKIA
jgi:hypothetical protein